MSPRMYAHCIHTTHTIIDDVSKDAVVQRGLCAIAFVQAVLLTSMCLFGDANLAV
jgi:hypothetical protein